MCSSIAHLSLNPSMVYESPGISCESTHSHAYVLVDLCNLLNAAWLLHTSTVVKGPGLDDICNSEHAHQQRRGDSLFYSKHRPMLRLYAYCSRSKLQQRHELSDWFLLCSRASHTPSPLLTATAEHVYAATA